MFRADKGEEEEKRQTSVYDVEVVLEEFEALDHTASNTTQDAFRNTNALEFVEASGVHILHAIINAGFDEEGAIELDYFRGHSPVENLELHHDTVQLGVVKLETDFLRRVRRDLGTAKRDRPSWP
jgi:hypothetical protein